MPLDVDVVLAGRRVLSLDVFDTCLARRVFDPTDTFCAVAVRYPELVQQALGAPNKVPAEEFRARRRHAEVEARTRSPDNEVTLEDILRHLVGTDDSEMVRALVEAELAVEELLAVPVEHVRQLAIEAQRRGCDVVYVSDMYLSATQIRTLLDRCGFPAGEVFVSSELRCSKGDGELFRRVLSDVMARPDDVVHIGDNSRADVEGARQVGIASILVPTWRSTMRDDRELFSVGRDLNLSDSLALGTAVVGSRHLSSADVDAADEHSIGRHILGPTMLLFASWLDQQCSELESSPILFCSRDALGLSEAWSHLGGALGRSLYFQVSRRSIGVPALAGGFDERARDLLCGGRRPLNARQLFARIGLGDDVVEHFSQLLGDVDVDVPRRDGAERDPVWDMFVAARSAVVGQAQVELEMFRKYWGSLGLTNVNDVWLVDVGWRGTVQASLQRCLELCDLPTKVHGRYLALMVPFTPATGSARGLLVSNGRPHLLRSQIEAGIPIVERLFQAHQGTVVRYDERGPELAPAPEPSRLEAVQQSALGLVREVYDVGQSIGLDTFAPSDQLARPLLRLLNQPRRSEVEFFAVVEHSSDLVDDNAEPIIPRSVESSGFSHLASQLSASEWRPGWIGRRWGSTRMRRLSAHLLVGVKQARYLWVRVRRHWRPEGSPPAASR